MLASALVPPSLEAPLSTAVPASLPELPPGFDALVLEPEHARNRRGDANARIVIDFMIAILRATRNARCAFRANRYADRALDAISVGSFPVCFLNVLANRLKSVKPLEMAASVTEL